jgi:hypothetical protein
MDGNDRNVVNLVYILYRPIVLDKSGEENYVVCDQVYFLNNNNSFPLVESNSQLYDKIHSKFLAAKSEAKSIKTHEQSNKRLLWGDIMSFPDYKFKRLKSDQLVHWN